MSDLATLFAASAERYQTRPFIVDSRGKTSFADLNQAVWKLAARLSRLSVKEERIAVLATGADYVVALFAVLVSGRTAVPIDPRLRPSEIENLMRLGRARVLLVADHEARRNIHTPVTLGIRESVSVDARFDGLPLTDSALILWTSGSTRAPKGVMLSHRNLSDNAAAVSLRYGFCSDDVIVTPLSLAHSFGLTVCLLAALRSGAELVLVDEPLPARLSAVARQSRATCLVAAASFFQYLTRSHGCRNEDLATLRFALSGACSLRASVATAFEAKFGLPILQTYGLTEASPVVTGTPPRENRVGSVGTALPGVELRVVKEQGRPETQGQLEVRGSSVMLGYFDNPEATAECIDQDGWLATGDIVELDASGYVTLLGRAKDVIVRAGDKIYPDEVEDVLCAHAKVRQAAVVGMPDPAHEEVPVAFVVAEPKTLEARELARFCVERLAAFKVPRAFHFVSELPTNLNGKVQRAELRRRLQAGSAR